MEKERIPVRILTGFLGCGKTTLLNAILTKEHGLGRVGVIENEYGEVSIDGRVVAAKKLTDENPVIEVSNGCLCCAVRGDLKRALLQMADQVPPVDSILLESSGVADPGPIIQTLIGDSDVASRCSLAGVVTVVDAKQFPLQMDSVHHPQVRPQIAFADLIVLNKIDLVYPSDVVTTTKLISTMNPSAEVIPAVSCEVPLEKVVSAKWFETDKPDASNTDTKAHQEALNAVKTLSINLPDAVMNLSAVELWLSDLVDRKGENMFRYKGIMPIRGHEEMQYLFQGVHQIFGGELLRGSGWGPPEKGCLMVFIGTELDEAELRAGLEGCLATDALRFEIGSRVECSTPAGWQDGTVTDTWKEGSPYLVVIDSRIPNVPGRKVYAPVDSDVFIRHRTASP